MTGSLNRTFYRETVLGSAISDERVARQDRDSGVYAGIRVSVSPLSRGTGAGFAWNAGANIPPRFVTAVARGVEDVMSTGVLAGLELVDVLVSVEDGSYHEEDSSEAAFREVTRKATMAALRQANPTVLEATSTWRASFPEEYARAIKESVSSEGGKIEFVQVGQQTSILTGTVPTSRAERLLQEILTLTKGQAAVSVESVGFREKPGPTDAVNAWPSAT
jgi:elongation factor G